MKVYIDTEAEKVDGKALVKVIDEVTKVSHPERGGLLFVTCATISSTHRYIYINTYNDYIEVSHAKDELSYLNYSKVTLAEFITVIAKMLPVTTEVGDMLVTLVGDSVIINQGVEKKVYGKQQLKLITDLY